MNVSVSVEPSPASLDPSIWREWVVGSGVHPNIVAANVERLTGQEALEALLYAAIPDQGHNRHYLTATAARLFDRYDHITEGGWAVSGVDPLNNWQRMQWLQFKPDHPRPDPGKPGKFVKYETPPKAESRALFLWVAGEQAEAIYQRYGVTPTPEDRAIGVWHIIQKYNLPIIITEGAKKAGCLLALGYAAIALPGITMGVRSRDANGLPCLSHLIPDLQAFATQGREWCICFDFETRHKTIQAIRHETDKLCKLLQLAGGKARIIQLPGPEKGVDDFVVSQGGAAFTACHEAAAAYQVWQINNYAQLSYKPSLELNQRYLGDLKVPDEARLVAIKSAKNTGKTETLVTLVDAAMQVGQPILLLTHRTQLGQAICDRIGLPYISELRNYGGGLMGYGLCVDSLHPESQARFDGSHWHNAIVIIDECEQVFFHLLSAKTTVGKHRIAILRQLRQLLINTLESDNGRVILMDADLSDLSIEFVLKESEARVHPWVIVNSWKPEQGWAVYHYPQNEPIEWYSALISAVEGGGHHFVCTHSQQAKSRWSTRTMEADLSRRFPDKRILRIDSQSIADPTHPAYGCISHLNEILGGYDIVLASPTIETGVSIDIRGHFTAVWGCFQGSTPENSVRQSLARIREPIERHIWIAKHGLNKVGNGATSPISLLASQKKMAQASLRLVDFDFDLETGEIVSHHAALNTWAKMAARINIGMLKYREIILYGLRQEGHQLTDLVALLVDRQELKEEITVTRDEQYLQECEAKCNAEEITPKEYEALQGKKTKTLDEWYKESKHRLQQRYKIEITPELIQKDDNGWHPQIRLYYFLAVGRTYLKDRDKAIAEAAVQSNELWLPTFNQSQLGVRIGALDYLGVPKLLDTEREFRGTDPDLIELAEKARAQSWALKQILGVSISTKDTPIAIVQKLLGKIGQKLTYDRREGGRHETRTRVYVYHPAQDGRNEVYVRWLEADQLRRSQSAVSTPGLNKLAG
jgi:hypothetical protein